MRWAAFYRFPPILRGVSASQIRADHDANQARIGSAPNVVPVVPDCRREIGEPYKQCGLTDGQEQENIYWMKVFFEGARPGLEQYCHRLD